MNKAKKKRNGKLQFVEAFIVALVVITCIAVNRGISYEHTMVKASYRNGISAIGIAQRTSIQDNITPLDDTFIAKVDDKNGVLVEYVEYMEDERMDYVATTSGYFELFNPKLRAGTNFSVEQNYQHVCVIGEELARSQFGTVEKSLGQELTTSYLNESYRIIGVLMDGEELPVKTVKSKTGDSVKKMNIQSNYAVVFPLSEHKYSNKVSDNVYRTIWIAGKENDLGSLMRAIEPYKDYMKLIVNPIPSTTIGDTRAEILLLVLLNGFTVLAFIVAGMGFMGIQLIEVFRRKEEIGLSMAVGATPWDIMKMIMAGTVRRMVIPISLGIVVGFVFMTNFADMVSIPAHIDAYSVILVFAVLILFGLGTSVYPALKAASLNPIEVMDRTPGLY